MVIEFTLRNCYRDPEDMRERLLFRMYRDLYGYPPCFLCEPIPGLKEAFEKEGIHGVRIVIGSEILQAIQVIVTLMSPLYRKDKDKHKAVWLSRDLFRLLHGYLV